MASWTSPRVSFSTLPISRVMSRAWSSLRSIRISAARKTISARRGAGTRRHLANARLAASTAASTSALFDRWKVATTSRVSAGLRSSKVRPLTDSTHSPSIKFLNTLVLVVPPSIAGLVRVSVAIGSLLGIVQNFYANNRGRREQGGGARRRGRGGSVSERRQSMQKGGRTRECARALPREVHAAHPILETWSERTFQR